MIYPFSRPISSTELSFTPVEDDRPGSAHCGHNCHCGHAPLAPPPLHCCPATRRAFSVNMNLAQEVKLILRELRSVQLTCIAMHCNLHKCVSKFLYISQILDKASAREGWGGGCDLWLEVRGDGDRQVLPDRAECVHRDDHRRHVHLRPAPHRTLNINITFCISDSWGKSFDVYISSLIVHFSHCASLSIIKPYSKVSIQKPL